MNMLFQEKQRNYLIILELLLGERGHLVTHDQSWYVEYVDTTSTRTWDQQNSSLGCNLWTKLEKVGLKSASPNPEWVCPQRHFAIYWQKNLLPRLWSQTTQKAPLTDTSHFLLPATTSINSSTACFSQTSAYRTLWTCSKQNFYPSQWIIEFDVLMQMNQQNFFCFSLLNHVLFTIVIFL